MADFKTYEAELSGDIVQKAISTPAPITGTFEEVTTPQMRVMNADGQWEYELWNSWKGLIMIVLLSCSVYALTDEFGKVVRDKRGAPKYVKSTVEAE